MAEAQQPVGGNVCAAGLSVFAQPGGEVEGDGLPAQCAALLGEPDQSAVDVEVHDPQAEGAAAPAGGFSVQPQEQRVEDGVVAAGAGDEVDLFQLVGGQGAADVGEPSGFGDEVGGAGRPATGRR